MVISAFYPYGVAMLVFGIAILAYTYWLYPWLVRSLPTRMPRAGTSAPGIGVSVIIAARRPGAGAARKVEELLEQSRELVREVVVVLDGPDGPAREALLSIGDARVHIVELPEWRGKAAALNAGVQRARSDILVMTDARQRVGPRAVAELLQVVQSPDVGAVSGALRISRTAGRATLLDWYWQRELDLREAESHWDSAVGVSGALYAVKRAYWRDLPVGLLLDDLAVAMNVVRCGSRVVVARTATVDDVPVGTDRVEFTRKVRTLTGNFQYVAWNPWVLLPWRNRIWWQFVSHKLLRLLTPVATACGIAGAGMVAHRILLPVIAATALVLLAGMLGLRLRVPFVVSLARTARSAVMINGALLVAAANAFRRRWDVWHDPARPAFRPER